MAIKKKDKQISEQSARFIKTARELACDEMGDKFERAIDKIALRKRTRRVLNKKHKG